MILKYDSHNLMKFSVFNQSHLVHATNSGLPGDLENLENLEKPGKRQKCKI